MKRSDFIKTSAAGLIGSTMISPIISSCSKDEGTTGASHPKAGWENWSGIEKCDPAAIVSPKNEEELVEAMHKAKGVRFVGSGHSFMPLVPTDHTIISIDQFNGVISHDKENLISRIKAGSKLAVLTREMDGIDQAFMNMPDVSYQTFAGAIGTATHGTGKDYKAMHGYVTAIKLITPKGDVIECSAQEKPDYFQAAKVSLGSLGAITEVSIQNRAPYILHRMVVFQPLEYVLENGPSLFEKHEHFELYYIPHTGYCMLISHDVSEGPLKPRESTEDEDGLSSLAMLRDYLSWSPRLREWVSQMYFKPGEVVEDYTDDSWRLLAQPRVHRFNESEYHIPKENGFECFKKVCEKLDSIAESFFPIELRLIKEDDAWLSPFYEKNCHSIAVHASAAENYKYLITDFSPIFREYGGRPHWGKLNNFTAKDFEKAYPKWNDFLAIREKCDPEGKLLNKYLKSILLSI